jgi:hypothetical protein
VTICRKTSEGGSSEHTDQKLTTTQTVSSMGVAPVPPPTGGTALMILSYAGACDSSRQLIEYLDGLKDAKADRKGTSLSFTTSTLWFSLLIS